MTTFDSIVFDVTSQSPQNLAYGVSSADASVIFVSGGNGTFSGKTAVGLLYNAVTGLTTNTTTLSVVPGITFRVHGYGYHGQYAALLFSDRSATYFQIVTASGVGPINITPRLSGAIDFENVGPDRKRLNALGFK